MEKSIYKICKEMVLQTSKVKWEAPKPEPISRYGTSLGVLKLVIKNIED